MEDLISASLPDTAMLEEENLMPSSQTDSTQCEEDITATKQTDTAENTHTATPQSDSTPEKQKGTVSVTHPATFLSDDLSTDLLGPDIVDAEHANAVTPTTAMRHPQPIPPRYPLCSRQCGGLAD